jgi:PAS domain S-box-containing protein
MKSVENDLAGSAPDGIFSTGGEMAGMARSFDWSRSALGPAEDWPQSLKTTISTCLNSRFAIVVWWGPELVTLYNDAYRAIIGNKHPAAFGATGKEVWPEIWHIIGPMLRGVVERGEATWAENLLLELERNGYPEECYFTFSYSPIHDESGGVGGVFTPVRETTRQVIGERRLRTLRDLAEAARAANAQSSEEVCRLAAQTLANNLYDVPFAAFYLFTPDGGSAYLAGSSGVESSNPLIPSSVRIGQGNDRGNGAGWFFTAAVSGGETEIVDLPGDMRDVPCGAWPVPPPQVLVAPVSPAGQRVGFALIGVNPRKRLDEEYRGFLSLIVSHVTTAIAEARTLEEERKQARALAEIDRAKTTFFSNVSHEFRTPLTLMLGPLEEILAKNDSLPDHITTLAAIAHRNGLRLQRLVNTLLDFSRIEAGRVQASFEPVDLAALTTDLASAFRSAMEKAGLRLTVQCAPLPEPVYVDREMWEKVVLNLLSNAFKHTFEGEVKVTLNAGGGGREGVKQRAILAVEDTGTGIPEQELPRIFERFHRVEGARGRSQEGTGIGLALVAELVKIHGGTISVRSKMGEGSTFAVSLPFGAEHLPRSRTVDRGHTAATHQERQRGTVLSPDIWVEEAELWVPRERAVGAAAGTGSSDAGLTATPRARHSQGKILIADDNADMRDYVARLLAVNYEVETAANGEQALAAVHREAPDLVLSDIMMPGLDGFGLLQALRSNPATSLLPVILLSARAGEEARIEGLQEGANDYLVKPFTARELLARVGAHIQMARLRREAARRESELRAEVEEARDQARAVLESITDAFATFDRDWRFIYVNPAAERLLGMRAGEILGRNHWELFPGTLGTIVEREYRRAARDRVETEFEYFHEPWKRWFAIRCFPARDGCLSNYFRDITERKSAEAALQEHYTLREAERRKWRELFLQVPAAVAILRGPNHIFEQVNREYQLLVGRTAADLAGKPAISVLPEVESQGFISMLDSVYRTGTPYTGKEQRLVLNLEDGVREHYFNFLMSATRDEHGQIDGVFVHAVDITDLVIARKRIEEANRLFTQANEDLKRANADLEQFGYSASHDLQEPLRSVMIYSELLSERYESKLDDRALEMLSYLKNGAARMERLIRDLLDYTQLQRLDVPEDTDCGEVIANVLANLQNAMVESGAEIEYQDLPAVRMHKVHLQQIFQNLIGNSLKYRSDQRPVVKIAAEKAGGEWIFSVKDNGIGIDFEYRERIFGLFKRLHTSERYSGTGIGLAICKRAVERYGGRIWVESERGRGSAFYFTVPAGVRPE